MNDIENENSENEIMKNRQYQAKWKKIMNNEMKMK